MAVFEIPLSARQQTIRVALGIAYYNFRFSYADTAEAGWFMDVNSDAGAPLVCGVPLLPGRSLLGDYPELGFVGTLYIVNDLNPSQPPQYNELGVYSHVYYETAS